MHLDQASYELICLLDTLGKLIDLLERQLVSKKESRRWVVRKVVKSVMMEKTEDTID